MFQDLWQFEWMCNREQMFGYPSQCLPALANISSLSELGSRQLAVIWVLISARHLSEWEHKCWAWMRGNVSRHARGMTAQAWWEWGTLQSEDWKLGLYWQVHGAVGPWRGRDQVRRELCCLMAFGVLQYVTNPAHADHLSLLPQWPPCFHLSHGNKVGGPPHPWIKNKKKTGIKLSRGGQAQHFVLVGPRMRKSELSCCFPGFRLVASIEPSFAWHQWELPCRFVLHVSSWQFPATGNFY